MAAAYSTYNATRLFVILDYISEVYGDLHHFKG